MNIGLTGSIGMGKSTIAQIFADFGVPFWDADAKVRDMYNNHDGLLAFVASYCPEAVQKQQINKAIWRQYLKDHPEIFPKLEELIHGYIRFDRQEFMRGIAPFKLFDIPLLFESALQGQFDKVIVVSAPYLVQRQRVLDRGEMTAEQFEAILKRQMPDEEKRKAADYIIDTNRDIEETRREVYDILQDWGYEHA